MGISLAQQVALLSDEEREEVLADEDPEALLYEWSFWGRPEQQAPEGGWEIWSLVQGRGAGKTRTGSEWIRAKARENPGCQIGLIARTSSDARDVMVEGNSGILSVHPPSEKPIYKPAIRRLEWPNGTTAETFSAAEPDQVRGPQFHYTWCDELAAWNHVPGNDEVTAWGQAQIATRLGDNPQILVTTTPKRIEAMKDLLAREGEDVVITRGSTMDNAGNLSERYLRRIYNLYKGTRQEQQELEGIMLDDVEGALWNEDLIQRGRLKHLPTSLGARVIAVDPSVAENPKDECGIIVAAASRHRMMQDRHAFLLEDASVHGSPDVWANEVVRMWKKWKCPVIAEVNQGSALVARMIHSIDPEVPVFDVRAFQGKAIRAEPVLLKYDQARVHHINYFGELEAQLCSWVPGETRKSPDRLDALVYAMIALLIESPKGFGGGSLRARAPRGALPIGHQFSRSGVQRR